MNLKGFSSMNVSKPPIPRAAFTSYDALVIRRATIRPKGIEINSIPILARPETVSARDDTVLQQTFPRCKGFSCFLLERERTVPRNEKVSP